MVDTETLEILSVHTGKGSQHDFKLFKNSKIAISKDTKKRVDLGYKGIEKIHKNVIILKTTQNFHNTISTLSDS